MLAGLKVSSLVFRCEFFRPEPNAKLNFENSEMQKWNA